MSERPDDDGLPGAPDEPADRGAAACDGGRRTEASTNSPSDGELPRRSLSRPARAALLALRVVALLMVGMTVYVFISQLL